MIRMAVRRKVTPDLQALQEQLDYKEIRVQPDLLDLKEMRVSLAPRVVLEIQELPGIQDQQGQLDYLDLLGEVDLLGPKEQLAEPGDNFLL